MRIRRKHNKKTKLKVRKKTHFSLPKGKPIFGIRAEVFLSDEEKVFASKLLGCNRVVYNKCLAFNNYWYGLYKDALKKNEEQPGAVPEETIERYKANCDIHILSDVFEAFKTMDEYSYLKEMNQKVLQQSVRHLVKAFEDFFDPEQPKKKHPVFKKKNDDNSCEFNSQAFGGIKGNRLNLVTGLQNILFKCSREHEIYLNRYQGWIQKVTLTKTKSDRYFISFNIADFREKRVNPKSTSTISDNVRQIISDAEIDNDSHVYYTNDDVDVGDYLIVTDTETGEMKTLKAGAIDPGIKTKGYISDGTVYENPKVYDHYHRREAMLQRRLARTKLKSKDLYGDTNPYNIPKDSPMAGRNHEKARVALAKHCEHMANVRENDTQKMTTDFVMRFDIIFREDTFVAGMVRNHKIALALSDACIGELNREIDYKCLFYDKPCIKTGRFFASSKICNHCGHKNDELELSDRVWVCPHCGKVVVRDYNASRNILEEGIRLYRA